MDEKVYISPEDIEIIDYEEYEKNMKISASFFNKAKDILRHIEKELYKAPAFINAVKASVPEKSFKAILNGKQKLGLAKGSLKLMTKKNGDLLAQLVDTNNGKIVSHITFEEVKLAPELMDAITQYSTQMQLAQIAEEIHSVRLAIEEVRQGQEYDRLGTAYSCEQKLLQALQIKNEELKKEALLRIAFDAEDSRNLLMLTQMDNLKKLKEQPETLISKFVSGAKNEDISRRFNEVRESLAAVNTVSLVQAIAYQEIGESDSAIVSLNYYSKYINKAYLDSPGFVERLDSMDPSVENYWSKTLPKINERIISLQSMEKKCLNKGKKYGRKSL